MREENYSMNSLILVLFCYVFFIVLATVTTIIILNNKKSVLNKISEISKNQQTIKK
jgi:hypothetical protein